MEGNAPRREVMADGRVQLASSDCSFVFQRLRPGVLLVTIAGHDAGQFGTGPLDEIRLELLRNRPLELLIDARDADSAAKSVSDEWTRFFSLNSEHLSRVSVLVGSKFMQLTVAIAQHLSRTGRLIELHSEPDVFDRQVASASAS
jgi:hypothetical protein